MSRRHPRKNTNPLRAVTKAIFREGRAGLLMKSSPLSIRWWELTLECGHEVERAARYEKGAANGRRGWAVLYHPAPADKALPAPKRVRCEFCGREIRDAQAALAQPPGAHP